MISVDRIGWLVDLTSHATLVLALALVPIDGGPVLLMRY